MYILSRDLLCNTFLSNCWDAVRILDMFLVVEALKMYIRGAEDEAALIDMWL